MAIDMALAQVEGIYAMEVTYTATRQRVGLKFLEFASGAQSRSIWNRLSATERFDLLAEISRRETLRQSLIGQALLRLPQSESVPELVDKQA